MCIFQLSVGFLSCFETMRNSILRGWKSYQNSVVASALKRWVRTHSCLNFKAALNSTTFERERSTAKKYELWTLNLQLKRGRATTRKESESWLSWLMFNISLLCVCWCDGCQLVVDKIYFQILTITSRPITQVWEMSQYGSNDEYENEDPDPNDNSNGNSR